MTYATFSNNCYSFKKVAGLIAVCFVLASYVFPAAAQSKSSVEETAWRVFIEAMKPSGKSAVDNRLTWETWIDQQCLYQSGKTAACGPSGNSPRPPSQRFVKSPLSTVVEGSAKFLGTSPPNFEGCKISKSTGRTICEEARLNPATAGYVREHDLQQRQQQALYATSHDVQFPAASVETKVDWIQYSGTCANVRGDLGGVYTEELSENGGTNCYVLAGIHLSSKLLPDWIWATFEPQNTFTNPKRCVVLGCSDEFGSVPAKTPPGQPLQTKVTARLQKMMQDAQLDAVFLNYRMDGVQTEFVTRLGKPTILANSIIEGENAGLPLRHASCITCHSVSSISKSGEDGITNLRGSPIGAEKPLPPGVSRRDFVWTLFLAGSLPQSAATVQ